MATATALSTSLPHLPPRRATSFLSTAAAVSLPVPSRTVRLRESCLAAAAPAAFGVLESTNGAIPTAAKGGGGRGYGREYFPLAAVVGQGNLQHEYAGSDSVLLDGPEVRQELISLLRYLKQCVYFSKKPYNVFLEYGDYGQNDVLIKKSKARVRKGATSVKERLTAATSTDVPFHHVVVQEGRVSILVLGYAHCGMVVAARWIAKQAILCLSKAMEQFPEYEVKAGERSSGVAGPSMDKIGKTPGRQTAKTVAIVLGGAVGLGFVVICLLFARSLVKKKDDY